MRLLWSKDISDSKCLIVQQQEAGCWLNMQWYPTFSKGWLPMHVMSILLFGTPPPSLQAEKIYTNWNLGAQFYWPACLPPSWVFFTRLLHGASVWSIHILEEGNCQYSTLQNSQRVCLECCFSAGLQAESFSKYSLIFITIKGLLPPLLVMYTGWLRFCLLSLPTNCNKHRNLF